MADDERRRLLVRIQALEQATTTILGELAKLKQTVESLAGGFASEDEHGRTTYVEPEAAAVDAADGVETSVDEERPKARARDEVRRAIDVEFWLGGRGLLLLGVVAFVFAVGFLLKYAFDHGWIGPLTRVLMATGAGLAAVVIGHRLNRQGYRVYGLWLAAGGFGAIYMSIWAAVNLYSLLPPAAGFVLMVLLVGAAGVMGIFNHSEQFAALAAFGGYLAPLLLQFETPGNLFGLAYLASLSAAGLWIAAREEWPYLAAISVAGGMLMTLPGRGGADLHGIYLAALSATAYLTARREGWHAITLLTVVLGWWVYLSGAGRWDIEGVRFAIYAGGLWLVSLLAWLGIKDWATAKERAEIDADSTRGSASTLGEMVGALVIAVPPLLFFFSTLFGVLDNYAPALEKSLGLTLALTLGAIYVVLATLFPDGRGPASRTWRYTVGFAFWLMAPPIAWSGIALARVWLLEGAILTVAGIFRGLREARWAGLFALVLAVLAYLVGASRPPGDPAFISLFSLTGLALSLCWGAWALSVRRARNPHELEENAWILLLGSGLLFLAWGRGEIRLFYTLMNGGRDWFLARELTISAFWMTYAAALLATGFLLRRPPVRWAGLGMAFIAATKVFVYDVSKLAQLYRAASFFGLAIVLLGLAFLYQRLRAEGGSESV